MSEPVRIEGKVICDDGQTVEFAITAEYGYQQWGNVDARLWNTLPLVEAINEAAREHLKEEA